MNLNRIRAPLFAFILAEELTRSYLPSYVNQLLVPIPGISPQVVIGLPIMLFMLIVALGQPYLGGWSERVGPPPRDARRRGPSPPSASPRTALAYNLYDLLLWRSLCALGYAMVFVAAQGYVLDRTGHAEPRAGLRALHRRHHGGHRVRPVDRRHPRRQHRLPRRRSRVSAVMALALDPRDRAPARRRGAPDERPRDHARARACARSWRSSSTAAS